MNLALYPSRVRSSEVSGDRLAFAWAAGCPNRAAHRQFPTPGALLLKDCICTSGAEIPRKDANRACRSLIPTPRSIAIRLIIKLRDESTLEVGLQNNVDVDGFMAPRRIRSAARLVSRNTGPVRIGRRTNTWRYAAGKGYRDAYHAQQTSHGRLTVEPSGARADVGAWNFVFHALLQRFVRPATHSNGEIFLVRGGHVFEPATLCSELLATVL